MEPILRVISYICYGIMGLFLLYIAVRLISLAIFKTWWEARDRHFLNLWKKTAKIKSKEGNHELKS